LKFESCHMMADLMHIVTGQRYIHDRQFEIWKISRDDDPIRRVNVQGAQK
jgi:hypothetical protein